MIFSEALMIIALSGASAAIDSNPRAPAGNGERKVRMVRAVRPNQVDNGVYYPGCNEVRAAGKAPLYAGQPGYREGMDGDRDGIACEPHRDRRR